MALVGRGKPPVNIDETILGKIQGLKKVLGQESVNTATRRYHFILKTMNGIDFQVNMENDIFYQTIFYQCLLEQKVANPKAF